MKKTVLTSLFVVAIVSLSVFNAQSQSKEEIKAKIEKMNAEMVQAMMNGDYEKALSFYAEDAISLPSYEPMLVGHAAIKESSEAMASSGAKMTSFEIFTEKIMMSGDLIVEIGKYKMAMEMPEMPEPMMDKGKYMTIWEKQSDGTLKIKADTWNTDQNPWMQSGQQM